MKTKGTTMKPILTFLAALLLVLLAALPAGRNLPGVPRFGKLRVGSFQALQFFGAMAFKARN
jgi:hypothetical protein